MLYRRITTLVGYWRSDGFRVCDYARNRRNLMSLDTVRILFQLDDWRDFSSLRAKLPEIAVGRLKRHLRDLRSLGIVEVSDDPPPAADVRIEPWTTWAPEAALLHFGTKNLRRPPWREQRRQLADRLELQPYPERLKTIPGARRRPLPDYPHTGSLPSVLLSRRTWRRFGSGAVSLEDVAALLGLTWGVQGWLETSPRVRSALKTSPSGGACHSIEVYLVAARVKGLPRGIYHYCPDTHELEVVRSRLRKDAMRHYLRQPWFADCPALFVMTSVFERVRFKYPSPRAYRVVLMEAGHLGQTFCLVATWLGLLPFSTAAFADSAIERQLGIDGVDEGVLYAAGVGRPPKAGERSGRAAFPERPPAKPSSHALRRKPHVSRP